MSTQITDTLKLFVGYDLNFTERAQPLVASQLQAYRLEGMTAQKSYWMRQPRTQPLPLVHAVSRFSTLSACSIS